MRVSPVAHEVRLGRGPVAGSPAGIRAFDRSHRGASGRSLAAWTLAAIKLKYPDSESRALAGSARSLRFSSGNAGAAWAVAASVDANIVDGRISTLWWQKGGRRFDCLGAA